MKVVLCHVGRELLPRSSDAGAQGCPLGHSRMVMLVLVHLCRIWGCGGQLQADQSRASQGYALLGSCMNKRLKNCFWRSSCIPSLALHSWALLTKEQHRAQASIPPSSSFLPLLLFLLPRCISTSVRHGSVPARLITFCLPEFPV